MYATTWNCSTEVYFAVMNEMRKEFLYVQNKRFGEQISIHTTENSRHLCTAEIILWYNTKSIQNTIQLKPTADHKQKWTKKENYLHFYRCWIRNRLELKCD